MFEHIRKTCKGKDKDQDEINRKITLKATENSGDRRDLKQNKANFLKFISFREI